MLLDVTDSSLFSPPDMRVAVDAQLRSRGAKPPKDLAGYVRLICDSLGRGHADAVKTFEQLSGRRFERILIVGGGSKSRPLCQATANAAGLPVVSFALEGSAVGNIASQLVTLGAVENLAAFRERLARSLQQTVYSPNA